MEGWLGRSAKVGSEDVVTTETILESISDGVFTIDLDWRISSSTRAELIPASN